MVLLGGTLLSMSTVARAAPEDLPDTPSRGAVVSAMQLAVPRIEQCGVQHGAHGAVSIRMEFGPEGTVVDVGIPPEHASTPLGACFAEAVRSVRLPPFRRPRFTVNYPFRY